MTLDTPQYVGTKKTFTQAQEIAVGATGLHTQASLYLNGMGGLSYLGFSGLNNTVGAQFRISSNTSVAELQCVNYNATTFGVLTASNFNQASDRAFKSDIQTLENVMARLRGKRGVTFLQKAVRKRGDRLASSQTSGGISRNCSARGPRSTRTAISSCVSTTREARKFSARAGRRRGGRR